MTLERKRAGGFTLIEVLVAVAVAGVIAVSAAALGLVVENLLQTEQNFGETAALRAALESVVNDVRATDYEKDEVFRIIPKTVAGGPARDVLVVWSALPGNYGEPPGFVVYRVLEAGNAGEGMPAGLYRQIVFCSMISNIDIDNLTNDNSMELTLPGVAMLDISCYVNHEWAKDYLGAAPEAVRLCVERGQNTACHETTLP